jgi:hypothetical protein
MDPRLRAAVDASVRWYDAVFAVHGIPAVVEGGVWSARGSPPRWHSAAKTVDPSASSEAVLRAVEPFEHCSVADSFGALDLSGSGFSVLFEASWVHRPPPVVRAAELPEGWSVVRDAGTLEGWNVAHDTLDVLVPSLLVHPRFVFLAQERRGDLVAGAVLHDPGGAVVELSNLWGREGAAVDPGSLLACAAVLHQGRALVGYARGEELGSLVDAGFVSVGPQVVWVR